MIKILSATRDNVVAQCIKQHLESQKDFLRLGRVESFADLIKTSQDKQPDILLLCQNFNGTSNITEVIRKYLQLFKTTKIVLIATRTDKNIVQEIMYSGVKSYIDIMDNPVEKVSHAIRLVNQGQFYLCPSALASVELNDNTLNSTSRFENGILGNREIEVLKLIAYGRSSKAIATQLDIATSTVDVHRRNIMKKLNISKVADLTRYAVQKKLINL